MICSGTAPSHSTSPSPLYVHDKLKQGIFFSSSYICAENVDTHFRVYRNLGISM